MTVTGYRGNLIYINLYSWLVRGMGSCPVRFNKMPREVRIEIYNFRLGFAGAGDGI